MADVDPDIWKNWWRRISRWAEAASGDRRWEGGDSSGGANSGDEAPSDTSGRRGVSVSPRGLLLLVLLGVGLMILGQRPPAENGDPSEALPANAVVSPSRADYADFIDELEREVTVAITQMAGVGNAKVLIVPKTSEIKVLAEEVTERRSTTERAARSGQDGTESKEESLTSRPVIVRNDADKVEEPVVRFTEKPAVSGVLVVADGALDPRIRLLLLQAVSTVLDVPPHRVEIVPRKR